MTMPSRIHAIAPGWYAVVLVSKDDTPYSKVVMDTDARSASLHVFARQADSVIDCMGPFGTDDDAQQAFDSMNAGGRWARRKR